MIRRPPRSTRTDTRLPNTTPVRSGRLYQSIRDLDKPVVVAMNGLATGAGLQMALHSDVRLAHPGVRMAQPEINAGLPSVLGSWLMLISIGLSRTQELALPGKLLRSEERRVGNEWVRPCRSRESPVP